MGIPFQIERLPLPQGHILNISLEGNFLASSGINFKTDVLYEVKEETKVVFIDMHKLDYINSMFVGELAALMSNLTKKGIHLIIVGASERVVSIFTGMAMDTLFHMVDTTEEAIQIFTIT